MFLGNPGTSVGYLLLAFITLAVGIFIALIIPLIGNLAYIILGTVIYAGFFTAGYTLYRNEKVDISSFFGGFDHLGQFAVLVLIQLVFFIALFIPLGAFMFFVAGSDSTFIQGTAEESFGVIGLMISIGVMVVFLAFFVGYLFSIPNIAHLQLKAWDAMELSRRVIFKVFLRMLGLCILLYVLNIAGALALGLGLFITIPVSFYALQAAWEQMIGVKSVNHLEQLLDEFGSDAEAPFESQY